MAKKTPPSESTTLPAVGDRPILRRSTRGAARTVAPPAADATAADDAIVVSSAVLFPASSSDTDEAAVALFAEPNKPSDKGVKSAKGMANDDAALDSSAIASHAPVAASVAVPIALIPAAPPSLIAELTAPPAAVAAAAASVDTVIGMP